MPLQPRWFVHVDLNVACAKVRDITQRWFSVLAWPGVPPFSGGILDSWPNRIAEGLVLCRQEWTAVQAAVTREAKEARRGGH